MTLNKKWILLVYVALCRINMQVPKNGIFAPKTLINLVINSFSNVLSYDIFDFSIHAAETGKKYHLGTRIIIRKSILYIISLSKP